MPSLEEGVNVIRTFAHSLPNTPGVYRMLNAEEHVLYVGKAKDLKRRVLSYTRLDSLPIRLQRMVRLTHRMVVVTTATESEALLLEAELIKKLKPRFNIIFRDDKNFPFLHISKDKFPRLGVHRGHKKPSGKIFGPFASKGRLHSSLELLSKAFLLRTCSDSIFNTRTRPCLEYHIKKCSAPCVGYISQEDYALHVKDACDFLHGRSADVQKRIALRMHKASDMLEYERAAVFRNQIQFLTSLQKSQHVHLSSQESFDVVAIVKVGNTFGVQVFFYRNGSHYGNRFYTPKTLEDATIDDVAEPFFDMLYASVPLPKMIITNVPIATYKDIPCFAPKRGKKKNILDMGLHNASESLRRTAHSIQLSFIEKEINRIEVYDNSHIQGTSAYGAFIVATPQGFDKSQYRAYSMPSTFKGDDYGMMKAVLEKRLTSQLVLPELIIIDGGKGQLNVAEKTLRSFNLCIHVIAVSKGPQRKVGDEVIYKDGKEIHPNNEEFSYILRLRDEAHKFALTAHKSKRTKSMLLSSLDEIPGIGKKRRRLLLEHFGSVDALKDASVADIQKVKGIHKILATHIWRTLRLIICFFPSAYAGNLWEIPQRPSFSQQEESIPFTYTAPPPKLSQQKPLFFSSKKKPKFW